MRNGAKIAIAVAIYLFILEAMACAAYVIGHYLSR